MLLQFGNIIVKLSTKKNKDYFWIGKVNSGLHIYRSLRKLQPYDLIFPEYNSFI